MSTPTEPRDPADVARGARARRAQGLEITNGERIALELDLDRPELEGPELPPGRIPKILEELSRPFGQDPGADELYDSLG